MFELRVFLEARRKRAKRPCPPGFLFCLKCREPRPPAGRMIEYARLAATSGNLIGLCPKCSGLMFRRYKQADVARFQAALTGGADAPIAADLAEWSRAKTPVPANDTAKPATSDAGEARL